MLNALVMLSFNKENVFMLTFNQENLSNLLTLE